MGAPTLSRVEPHHCMMPQKMAACSVISSEANVRPLMSMMYLALSPRSILRARSSINSFWVEDSVFSELVDNVNRGNRHRYPSIPGVRHPAWQRAWRGASGTIPADAGECE